MENKIINFSNELDSKTELLKNTICKGTTNDEFELFLNACKRLGLDPFSRQIYAVKRWNSESGKKEMTIQTSIDGLRLIADRTGRYAPGKETLFVKDADGALVSATAYVKKMSMDGSWHEYSATAFFSEYCVKNKEGKLNKFWRDMPHVMLSKVSESLALRKGFPAEMSGVYTREEMAQADEFPSEDDTGIEPEQFISSDEVAELEKLISRKEADELLDLVNGDFRLMEKILNFNEIEDIKDLQSSKYSRVIDYISKWNEAKSKHIKQKRVSNG